MKTTYIFLVLSLVSFLSFSQVGINTSSPDQSSILDVSATNKGVLFPRVALTGTVDNSTITNPAVSLFVYNTSSNGGLTPGFYFWNGSSWSLVSNGGATLSTGWELTGNSGTDGGSTNFLGTTDNKSLVFKTNNIARTRITTKGQIEVLNTGNSLFLGEGAGASDDLSQNENIFIGKNSGNKISTGEKNIVIGNETMLKSTNASNNILMGYRTGNQFNGNNNIAIGENIFVKDQSAPTNNIAIGKYAGEQNGGTNNIMIGEYALSKDSSNAQSNIAIGRSASKLNVGSNNIAIGELALSKDGSAYSNIAIGKESAKNNTGSGNIVLGELALSKDGAAANNIVIGKQSALNNTGSGNIVVGEKALSKDGGASNNIVLGKNAGLNNSGSYNIILGENTLTLDRGASNNILVGFEAGKNLENNNNTFVGYQAGSAAGNITNSSAIGNNAQVTASNQIVLGNNSVTEVKTSGSMRASNFISNTATYPDYVFEDYYHGNSEINDSYKFSTIEEAETFVLKNGHLPGVKSYKEIKENNFDINVTETTVKNLEKIEEQFLYITELNSTMKEQKAQIEKQQQEIDELKAMLTQIIAVNK